MMTTRCPRSMSFCTRRCQSAWWPNNSNGGIHRRKLIYMTFHAPRLREEEVRDHAVVTISDDGSASTLDGHTRYCTAWCWRCCASRALIRSRYVRDGNSVAMTFSDEAQSTARCCELPATSRCGLIKVQGCSSATRLPNADLIPIGKTPGGESSSAFRNYSAASRKDI